MPGANSRVKPVQRATNRTWDEWLAFMDRMGARDLDHKAIALKVYGVPRRPALGSLDGLPAAASA